MIHKEIHKGEPIRVRHTAKHAWFQKAFTEAELDTWFYAVVNGDLQEAERLRSSVSSGNGSHIIMQARRDGFRSNTAVRWHKHDETIPEGVYHVYFKRRRHID